MVLMIIIPFLNGYFIGNIAYFQTSPCVYLYLGNSNKLMNITLHYIILFYNYCIILYDMIECMRCCITMYASWLNGIPLPICFIVYYDGNTGFYHHVLMRIAILCGKLTLFRTTPFEKVIHCCWVFSCPMCYWPCKSRIALDWFHVGARDCQMIVA